MRIVTIRRDPSSADGTFGRLVTDGFECYTAELPDRGNAPGISRIPPGTYPCIWGASPSRKLSDGTLEYTYRLQNVPEREGVLIHAGNFAGDKALGYASDVEGCILLGRAIMDIEVPPAKHAAVKIQRGVSSSRDTVGAFARHMGRKEFNLVIEDAS